MSPATAPPSLDILLPVPDMNFGFSADNVPMPTPGA
jgi:hypothetical protein